MASSKVGANDNDTDGENSFCITTLEIFLLHCTLIKSFMRHIVLALNVSLSVDPSQISTQSVTLQRWEGFSNNID